MWTVGSNSVMAFDLAGGNGAAFADTWASGLARDKERGDAWETDGPGITLDAYQPPLVGIGDGITLDFGVAQFANTVHQLSLASDMIHVQVEGHGRLSDGSIDTTALEDVWFCVDGHDCTKRCPEDPDPPAFTGTIGTDVLFAVSGSSDGSLVDVEGVDLRDADECETPEPSPTLDEFCTRYRAMVDWVAQQSGTDFELTQPWAAEIARRSRDMRPYAPDHLIDDVDLYIRVYGTFATAPEPANVPIVGPEAAGIANAVLAMNEYCGISF
jgi:hypothetical protein